MNPSLFRSTLKTGLDGRSAVSNLNTKVFRYPPGKQAVMTPTLWIVDVATAEEDGTLLPSSTLDRTYTVTGGGYCPSSGHTDAKYATAESNAWTLIEELGAQLIETTEVDSERTYARLTGWEFSPSTTEDGKVFIDFTWTASVRVVA